MLTARDIIDHAEYALRAVIVTSIGCVLAFWIGLLVSDKEVEA